MKRGSPVNHPQFWLILLIFLVIIIVSIANYLRWWDWRFSIGPFTFTHWLGWLGAAYITIVTPLYPYLKRRFPGKFGTWFKVHVFGNLLAFFLISIHYTQQEGRPAEFTAVHSTGLILFIIVTVLVLTGFLLRFGLINRLIKSWRFIHVSLSLSYYIVLIVHVLQFYDIL